MNKEIEKIKKDHPQVTAEDKLDSAALSRVRILSTEINNMCLRLESLCVNYHAEIKRQGELKLRRQKVIASTPKPDPNPNPNPKTKKGK